MKEMKWMMLIMLAVLAGCKGKNNLNELRAQEWELKSMTVNDTLVKNPEQLPTLVFTDSTAIYGSAGCNRFFGTYTADATGSLKIMPGGATMMFCPDMDFEDRYLKSLSTVESYTVSNKELTLKDAAGRLSLVYGVVDTTQRHLIGVAKDDHGCNAAAGYTWSEVRGDCIRIFEEGIRFMAVNGQDTTLATYVVFSTDSLKAEVFMPDVQHYPVLERRQLPQGGYAWNQEDDDTYNLRRQDGAWIIEQQGDIVYRQSRD